MGTYLPIFAYRYDSPNRIKIVVDKSFLVLLFGFICKSHVSQSSVSRGGEESATESHFDTLNMRRDIVSPYPNGKRRNWYVFENKQTHIP